MKKIVYLALVAIALNACGKKSEDNTSTTATEADTVAEAKAPTLTKAWETDTVLTTVESVYFDATDNVIYTSNIEGDPTEKDKKGSISKVSTDGKISEPRWVTGLNAPKGIARLNDKLYVTDIDELVEINIADGKVVKKYPVKGAGFLNDAASDGSKVYISDSKTGKVHVLENGKINLVTSGKDGINGLRFNPQGELFILDGKGLRKFNVQDTSSTFVNEVVTGGDGLVIIDDSTYIASRWQGEIYLVKNGKETLLLDTKEEKSNTADIDYIPEQKLVIVPTFFKNKVVAYKLDY